MSGRMFPATAWKTMWSAGSSGPLADEAGLLDELINQKVNEPLDFNHPLWQMTLVDNFPAGGVYHHRPSAHDCIADGISLVQIFLQMTRASAAESAESTHPVANILGETAGGHGLKP